MTDELKPCPFCGRRVEHVSRACNQSATGMTYIVSCFCGGYSACAHQQEDTLEEVVKAWNTRALTAAQPAQVVDEQEQVYSAQLTKAKRLLVDLHKIGDDRVRSMIEARTGPWFVWGQDRASLPTQPAAQATLEPDTCRKRPRCGRADPCAWLEKQATQQAAGGPALERYKRLGIGDEESPIERLRGFLSIALSDQDWLDVEPFLDALTHPAPGVPEVHKIDVGFRWDGDAQQHIPSMVIEFEPVKAGDPTDAKGWRDRDALSAMLAAAQAKGGDHG